MTIEYRWADGHAEWLPTLAVYLVRMQVAVIAATGGGGARRSRSKGCDNDHSYRLQQFGLIRSKQDFVAKSRTGPEEI